VPGGCPSLLGVITPEADVVSVERVIPAPPEAVFALISDASRHQDFDGSGTVRGVRGTPEPLRLGSTFGMKMHLGVPYAMRSTVVDYDENTRLAWQTRAPVSFVDRLAGGRIWRYELEPVEGGTLVRESWDISQEAPFTKPVVKRAAEVTRKNMAKTLERIEQVLTQAP
jgi:uncharacterized protein YndB with AHSA1/START domain